jgi:hypothetical protein
MGSHRALRRSLSIRLPALMLGMAAGLTGGVWAASAMDATPYNETDLNTAERNARMQGSADGLQQAKTVAAREAARQRSVNADQIGLVEGRLAELREAQQKADKQAQKEAEEQQAKMARLQSSLAETTAALNNATAGGGGVVKGQQVEGTLRSTWTLGSRDKPWPTDCAKPLQAYQVRVSAGAGVTVATARLVDAEVVRSTTETATKPDTKKKNDKRDAKNDTAILVCSMTYSATLPTPLGDGYQFAVVEAAKPEASLQTKAASAGALGNGSAPALTVTRQAG